MSKIPLHTQILIGLLIGTVAGLAAGFFWGGTAAVEWITNYLARPVGQIFLRLLLMVVVPLVFATLVLGVAGLGDPRRLGSMGVKTLAFFVGSTTVAATLGLVLVNLLRPGDAISGEGTDGLVSAETFAKLHTAAPGTNYSLGWSNTQQNWANGSALDHNGSNTVWFATVWIAPQRDMGMLAVTNAGGDEGDRATDEIVEALISRFEKAFGN